MKHNTCGESVSECLLPDQWDSQNSALDPWPTVPAEPHPVSLHSEEFDGGLNQAPLTLGRAPDLTVTLRR